MMEISFNTNDIESWASFSGDRNPIHFDIKAARKLGVNKVVVHGMLVLLPLKQQISSMTSQRDKSWTIFKASFKTPILINDKVIIEFQEKRKKLIFKVFSSEGENQHLIGNISQVEIDLFKSNAPINLISENEVCSKFNVFFKEFNQQNEFWIWLDALIFGHFLRYKLECVFSELNFRTKNISVLNGLEGASDYLVVQFNHQTTFNNTLRKIPIKQCELPRIGYQIDNISLSEDDNGAFGTLELMVLINNKYQMKIDIGLLIKLNKNN